MLPNSPTAESTLLGAAMLDATILGRCKCSSEDFYSQRNSVVFRTMQDLYRAKSIVDLVTIGERLRQAGRLEDVGGQAYLMDLADSTVSAIGWESWEQIILDKATLRAAYAVSDAVRASAMADQTPSDDVVASLVSGAQKVALRGSTGHVMIQSLLEAITTPNSNTAISTGMDWLDREVSIRPGHLVVIAGRPSEGKSALATQIAAHVAATQGEVLFCSLEMSPEEQAERIAAQMTGVPLSRIAARVFRQGDIEDMTKAFATLDCSFSRATTPQELRASVMARASHGRLKMIVLDYLQLMRADRPTANRATDVSEISRSLKMLAMETGCPVIALSQLNRQAEEKPQLHHLRESGAIEQDANTVLSVHTDTTITEGLSNGESLKIITVLKQRGGQRGIEFYVDFYGPCARFGHGRAKRNAPEYGANRGGD
jgi:replicative DNA helicase